LALLLALPLQSQAAEESGGGAENRQAGQNEAAGMATKDNGPAIDADQLSKPPKLTKQAKIENPQEAIGKGTEVEIPLPIGLDDKGSGVNPPVDEPKTPTG